MQKRPEAYRTLRSWLRFRSGSRGDFDRYLMQSAMQRRAPANAGRRTPMIQNSVRVALIVLFVAAAATFALWSLRPF